MNTASLGWGAIDWAVPVACVGAAFGGLILWAYAATETARAVRLAAALLKMIAVALLLCCLLEPLLSGARPRPGANVFAVVVDNSQSMRMSRAGLPDPRVLRSWFGDNQPAWRARLEQNFDVRYYAFDRSLRPMEFGESIQFDGDASNLATTLDTLNDRFSAHPLAGTLLVSDGNLTDATPEFSANLPARGPIYPIVQLVDSRPIDLRLDQVRVSQTLFESSPSIVTATVMADGLSGMTVDVQLIDDSGGVIEEQSFEVKKDHTSTPIRFRFRPDESGVSFYRLHVAANPESTALADGKELEATNENNSHTVLIHRGGGPFRVLYVSGRPNWEFKFLRRALQNDDELQLVALLRIANKEPRFQFRDQSGTGVANPLYRGFGADDEAESETYEQPVFVRIGVENSQELAEGFPSTTDTLFAYDAVIIDDLEAAFFDGDQMLLLRRYVSQRGGGLLMLGGPATFADGGYAQTPIGDMLPVYLKPSEGRDPVGRHRLRLTREGLLETWARLRTTEELESTRLDEMPGFYSINAIGHAKPGATSVAESVGRSSTQPAIVTHRFGRGRTSAMLIGDLWRWPLQRRATDDDDSERFWRQLVRWLVADVPQRMETEVDAGAAGQSTTIRVRVNTPEFEPDDNAKVDLSITRPGGETIELTADPSGLAAGTYEAQFWPSEPGGYRVVSRAVAGDGRAIRAADVGWVFQPQQSEFQTLTVNNALLSELASKSGGRAVAPTELDAFVENLDRLPVPVVEEWVAPMWHQAWVFTLAIACLCGEWGLRRWKGLP